MRVVLEFETAPGFGVPAIFPTVDQSLASALRVVYPYQSVIQAAETNGLKVVRASISD